MFRKLVIAVSAFYLLGVVGVGGNYLSNNWSDDWALGDQLANAITVGATWPALVVGMVSRA